MSDVTSNSGNTSLGGAVTAQFDLLTDENEVLELIKEHNTDIRFPEKVRGHILLL
jgi:hypothetical protein